MTRQSRDNSGENHIDFQSLFENTAIGMYRTTPDGRILLANPALVRMLGYESLDALKLRNLEQDGFEPDYPRETFIRSIEEKGEIKGLESAWTTVDGKTLYVREYAHAVRDTDGAILYFEGTAEDITPLKEIRSALQTSEERIKLAVEGAGLGLWDQDFTSNTVYRSPEWARMLGYADGEVDEVLQSWKDLIHPEDTERVLKAIDMHESGKSDEFRVEHRLRTKSGAYKWILNWGKIVARDDEGIPVRALGIHMDITAMKEAQQAVAESEEKYRSLVQNIPIGVVRTSMSGQVISANPAAAKISGYQSVREVMKLNAILGYKTPEDRAVFIEKLSKNGIVKNYETNIIKKGGNRIWVSVTSRLIRGDDQQPLYIDTIFEDITERKEAIEIIEQSEAKFRMLAERSPNMIFINYKGRLVYVNERCCDVMGYTAKEFLSGQFDFMQLIAPESVALIREKFAKHMRGKEVRSYEYHIKTKDGRTITAVNSARLIPYEDGQAILGIVTDITELRRTEKALESAHLFLENLIDTANAMVLTLDTHANITSFNQFACHLTGYSKKEVTGKNWINTFIRDDDSKEIQQTFKQVMEENKESFTHENSILCKNGDIRIISWKNTLIKNLAGETEGILSIGIDVTEQTRIRQALEKSEKLYYTLAEAAQDYIFLVDQECILQYVNSYTAEKYGLPRENIVGSFLGKFYPDEVTADLCHQIEDVFLLRKTLSVEYKLPFSNDLVSVHTRLVPILDESGAVVNVLGISRDISEIKHIQEELDQHRKDLEAIVFKRTSELQQKNAELERLNNLFIGREFRIKELKEKVKTLEKEKRKRRTGKNK